MIGAFRLLAGEPLNHALHSRALTLTPGRGRALSPMLSEPSAIHVAWPLRLVLFGSLCLSSMGAATADSSVDNLPRSKSWLRALSYDTWSEERGFLSFERIQLTFSTSRSDTSTPVLALAGLGGNQSTQVVAAIPLTRTMRLGASVGFQYPQISARGFSAGFHQFERFRPHLRCRFRFSVCAGCRGQLTH